jgi:lipopolysaccharide biosynthesis glycosyltransferase
MAELSINELKKYYNGDIILLTNENIKIDGCITIMTEINPIILRMHIDEFVDIKSYDQIMYLDSDIIPLKRINELWTDEKIGAAAVATTIEQYSLSNKSRFMTSYMSAEEIEKFGKNLGLCNGTFTVPINNKNIVFFKSWRDLCYSKKEEHKYFGQDQASFCKIIMNSFEYIEYARDLVCGPSCFFNMKKDGALYHFIKGIPEYKLNKMEKMIKSTYII